jgi:predicted AAA+ superfamily ATPase
MNLFPLTFKDYLNATGKSQAAGLISGEPQMVSAPIHNLLNEELKKYFLIGGMPECVRTYADTNSIQAAFEVQSDLINTFRQDFSKYAGRADKNCLNAVLTSSAQKVGQQIKYSTLAEGYSNPTIKNAFELLETARLISRVSAASPAGLPLGASVSSKKFKAIMLDCGLLAHLSGLSQASEFQKEDLLAIFRGALAEQFIGQEARAAAGTPLYYWSREARNSNAETDYLIEKQGQIIPIEVKSGKSGSLKSIHLLLETFKNVKEALVFSDAPFGELTEKSIRFLPLYFAGSVIGESHKLPGDEVLH